MTMIRDVLSNAGGWARNDAKAAGDEELADQLVDFADDWRKTRNHMLQEIDKFQEVRRDRAPQGFEARRQTNAARLALTGGGGNIE